MRVNGLIFCVFFLVTMFTSGMNKHQHPENSRFLLRFLWNLLPSHTSAFGVCVLQGLFTVKPWRTATRGMWGLRSHYQSSLIGPHSGCDPFNEWMRVQTLRRLYVNPDFSSCFPFSTSASSVKLESWSTRFEMFSLLHHSSFGETLREQRGVRRTRRRTLWQMEKASGPGNLTTRWCCSDSLRQEDQPSEPTTWPTENEEQTLKIQL